MKILLYIYWICSCGFLVYVWSQHILSCIRKRGQLKKLQNDYSYIKPLLGDNELDNNCCVPVSLMVTTGWDFRSCQILSTYYMKRKLNKGVWNRDLWNFLEKMTQESMYGIRLERYKIPKTTILSDSKKWSGTYFVVVPGHALSVIDGRIISTAMDNMSSKVLRVYKVIKEK
jgi:hypothetical protein